ncbi:MAG TPA: hypothetical protein VH054_23190 [Polyangiaceae bacterium]|nr:hypothetical protein [Polyangiaceae bacterium]
MNRRALGICVVLAALLGVAWWVRSGASKKSVATEREGVVVASTSNGATAVARASAIASARVVAPAKTWSAKWGSGRGELGRDRPSEGNPEGPMSFVTAGKDLLVVDQVNQRLVRYDKDGKVKGTQAIGPTVQDVAVGKDGTVALLDRLGDKNVTVTDSNGKRIGTLPLGTGDPGNITGVFVDGNTVYVEEGHGGLTGVGTTDGQPMQSPVTLGGRPTKDGALLVTGTLVPAEGKLTVNAIDRTSGTLRFARLIQMPRPSSFIVLLDSDDRGVVYAGVAAGDQATVACLDPNDGHVLGRIVMPMNGDPDETFRDFSVDGDGTILHAVRDDTGVTYATTTCP